MGEPGWHRRGSSGDRVASGSLFLHVRDPWGSWLETHLDARVLAWVRSWDVRSLNVCWYLSLNSLLASLRACFTVVMGSDPLWAEFPEQRFRPESTALTWNPRRLAVTHVPGVCWNHVENPALPSF